MGSRAVLVLCRDGQAAHRRFGVPEDGTPGACYTRTGRRFFDDDALDRELVTRLADALGRANFWERFATDWVCLDTEILPWNAKAQGLLREQYAPVAAAGTAALAAAVEATEQARHAAWQSVNCWDACMVGRSRSHATPRPIAPTAGRWLGWRVYGSRRFTCWPPRATPTSTATTSGTWQNWLAGRG